jgi:hypothetical protein
MATNPFAGTEFEQSWDQGFTAGFIDPDGAHPPSPLTPDQQDAFSQGITAGQISERGVVVPPAEPPENETWQEIAHGAEIIVDAGHAAFEIMKGAAVVGTVGEAVLCSFLSVAIWGPTPQPFFEEAATQAVAQVRQQLQDAGIVSENVELFMAACNRTDHGTSDLDALTRQGWFHGTVFLSFDQALAEATAHDHPDATRVLRFQSAAPDTIDVIELSPSS